MLLTTTLILCTSIASVSPFGTPKAWPQTPTDSTAWELPTDKAQKRLLLCRGGVVLRRLARTNEHGEWETRKDGQWTVLPRGLVLSYALEKEVEREFEQRMGLTRRMKGSEQVEQQCQIAAWALDQGLLTEGLATLDRILKEQPDSTVARNSATAHSNRLGVPRLPDDLVFTGETMPGALESFLTWSSACGAALREAAILKLAVLREREGLLTVLTGELGSRQPQRRTLASLALRRLYKGKAVRPLILHAVLDPDREMRTSSALTLGAAQDNAVTLPFVKALASRDPLLRQRSVQALGLMAYPAAVEPLAHHLKGLAQPGAAARGGPGRVPHSNIYVGTQTAYLQDFDVEVAMGSAIADPIVNVLTSGNVLDVGVISVSQSHFATESRSIRTALGNLTGVNPGKTNRAWIEWWDQHGAAWLASQAREPESSMPQRF